MTVIFDTDPVTPSQSYAAFSSHWRNVLWATQLFSMVQGLYEAFYMYS